MTPPGSEASPTILVGHDVASRACDLLMARLARSAFPGTEPQIEEIASLEDAWEALDRLSPHPSSALVVACLDLKPSPRAGVTFASWAAALALPVVVVTHSARWVGADSPVAGLPLLNPNASSAELAHALEQARSPKPSWFAPDEAFPSRPSWLG
jgi:hypothetical protein